MAFSRRFRLTKNLIMTTADITATKASSNAPSVPPIIVLVTTKPSLCGSVKTIITIEPTESHKGIISIYYRQFAFYSKTLQ